MDEHASMIVNPASVKNTVDIEEKQGNEEDSGGEVENQEMREEKEQVVLDEDKESDDSNVDMEYLDAQEGSKSEQ
jgi:hypothetical protein